MNFSNFPLQGSLAESLKNSYQTYWKQDAEARESNRQFLVKLQRFEFKSAELCSRTQMAHQMKTQYDKMLMNQNPLLWAQIQRTLASDLTGLHCTMPKNTSVFKASKEVAVNTIDSSSCSEDGVWPHSPSPHPDVERKPEQFPGQQEIKNLQEEHKMDNTKIPFKYESPIVPTFDNKSFHEKPNFLSPRHSKIHSSPAQSDIFLSTHSSPSTVFDGPYPQLEVEENQQTKESLQVQNPVQQPTIEVEKLSSTFLKTTLTAVEDNDIIQESSIPVVPQPVYGEVEKPEAPNAKPAESLKLFRLDSDSESESGPVSGPTGPPAEDSSDSFWN